MIVGNEIAVDAARSGQTNPWPEGTMLSHLQWKPEINPDDAMIVRLDQTRSADADLAKQVAEQVFDNALVAAGLLEDPRAMLNRMNSLLEKLLAKD